MLEIFSKALNSSKRENLLPKSTTRTRREDFPKPVAPGESVHSLAPNDPSPSTTRGVPIVLRLAPCEQVRSMARALPATCWLAHDKRFNSSHSRPASGVKEQRISKFITILHQISPISFSPHLLPTHTPTPPLLSPFHLHSISPLSPQPTIVLLNIIHPSPFSITFT